MTSKPAIVLLSGGLDSATVLAIARADRFACHALTFDYGQRHRIELEAARRVARHLGAASHRCIPIDAQAFGTGSALTGNAEVPKDREESQMRRTVPATYVPARNTIFLSFALGLAEVLGSNDIFIGVNAVDYSGYPDCRPEFVESFEAMANFATAAGVAGRTLSIRAPLIHLPKARIIQKGLALGVDYGLTHSCYDPAPGAGACGRCDACRLRAGAFAELGMQDPALSP